MTKIPQLNFPVIKETESEIRQKIEKAIKNAQYMSGKKSIVLMQKKKGTEILAIEQI